MSGHVVEFAVEAGIQPCAEPGFCRAEVDMGDTYLLKTEREAPALDVQGKFGRVG